MKEITKIIISGASGYCCADEAYNDKLTIEKNSISYSYKPIYESEINPVRKWSHKTNSPVFEKIFRDVISALKTVEDANELDFLCTDVGEIDFIVVFSDKSRWKKCFSCTGDDFSELIKIIRKMVPEYEYMPAVLLLSEDFEE